MSRRLLRLSFALPGLLLAGIPSGWAQGTPAEAVDSAFRLLAHRDWSHLAALVHPRALEDLRAESLLRLILAAEARRAGKDTWSWGGSPRKVLTTERLSAVGKERVPTFPAAPTIAELASKSSRDYFVAWCKAAYGSHVQRAVRTPVPDLQRHVVGVVQEGDSFAHVLYRRESEDVSMRDLFDSNPGRVLELFIDLPGRLMIMPVQKADRGWQILINGPFSDFGSPMNVELVPDSSGPSPDREVKRTTRVAPPPALPAHWPEEVRPGPAETVRLASLAFESRDWERLATFVHPERLAVFQREQLRQLARWPTTEAMFERDRTDSARMVMYVFDDSLSSEAMAKVADLEVPGFPRTPTIGELAALSPAAFFVRWCEAVYEGDPEFAPGAARVRWQRHVIGEVVEDGLQAHVLYRGNIAYGEPWYVHRMSLRRTDSTWGLLLNEDIGWKGDVDWLFFRR